MIDKNQANETVAKKIKTLFKPQFERRITTKTNTMIIKQNLQQQQDNDLSFLDDDIQHKSAKEMNLSRDKKGAYQVVQEVLYEIDQVNEPQENIEELHAIYEKALEAWNSHFQTPSIFLVQHKDEFEMLQIYSDKYPFLQQRKQILFIMKYSHSIILFYRTISYFSYKIIKHTLFENIVLLIILFNTVMLILDDPTTSSSSQTTENIELFFLIAYSIEMALKIIGLGFIIPKTAYLRDGWNILDFTIVVSSYIPIIFEGSSGVNLQSLRSLRVLRPLRTITTIRPLKVLLATIFAAIPYLVNTIIILFFFFLVFAIGGVQLFKGLLKFRCFHHANGINTTNDIICGGEKECPYDYLCGKGLANPNFGVTNFDTIFYAFLMVFQCVTLEGWTEIMYWIFDSFSVFTVVYFIVLVVVGAFFLLNLTLAVIKAKFTAQETETEPEKPKTQKEINENEVEQFLDNQEHEIENQKKIQKIEAQDDSSDEEIPPNLEELIDFRRKMRPVYKNSADEKKRVLEFVWEDLNEMKEKIRAEFARQEEVARTQQMYENFVEQQKKQLSRVLKQKNKKKQMHMHMHKVRQSILHAHHHEVDQILKELDDIKVEESPKSVQKQYTVPSPPLNELIKLKSAQIHHQDQDAEILEDIFKEIEENQEEEFRKNNPQLFENIEDDEDEDENNFLDDSDFIEKSNRMDREQQNLAQHIFEQNYKKQKQFQRKKSILKRKTLLYSKPINQKGKMHFINRQTQQQKKEKEMLLQREKQMIKENMTFGGEEQKKQMNIMQELIQQDDNQVMEEDIEEQRHISEEHPNKKNKKKGQLRDYKLVLTDFQEYQSHSHSDVLEIQQKAKIKYKLEKLQKEIKVKHYTFVYFEKEGQETHQNNNASLNGSQIFDSQLMTRSGTFYSTENKGNNSPQNEEIKQISKFKIPVGASSRIISGNFKAYEEERLIEQSIFQNRSKNVKRPYAQKRKMKEIPQNYQTSRKTINTVIHPIFAPKEWDADNELYYMQLLQNDFNSGVKEHLIYSGYDVTYSSEYKRHNKIVKKIEQQDSFIWLVGLTGLLLLSHKQIQNFVKSKFFENFLTIAVFANTTVLALDGTFTDPDDILILTTFNDVFTWIFIVEMGLKLIALSPIGYIRDKMNIFDGIIVIISIVEMTVLSGSGGKAVSAFRAVRIFRTFRVLRVTRLLRSLAFMQVIIGVISRTINSFVYILMLLMLFILIYALLGMQIYGGKFQFRKNDLRASFNSFHEAFLSVFQLLTLENWNDILILAYRTDVHILLTSVYLISWIFIGNFVFLNLFLAILLDGFTNQQAESDLDIDLYNQDPDRIIWNQLKTQILESNQDFQKEKEDIEEQIREFNQNDKQMRMEEQEFGDLVEEKQQKKTIFEGIQCEDSLYLFSKQNVLRIFLYRIVTHPQFENFILFLIVLSSIKLAVDTYFDEGTQAYIVSSQIDYIFNVLFSLEAVMKIIAFGFFMDANSYLTESWSQLDFFIVISSMIDMSMESIDLPVIKILRLLRTLRPLRFISHNVNLKVVVIALFESVGAMLNVIIVVLLIWLMFAILGMSLLQNRMGYCDTKHYYGINIYECQTQWLIHDTNFDNIASAMSTLYIISSLEGWPDIMYPCIDSDYPEYGPTKNNIPAISYFFLSFILVGSFFLINLFVGVIFFYFNQAQKNERSASSVFLTQEQANWIEIQRMTIGVKTEFTTHNRPNNVVRAFIYDIIIKGAFEAFIMICIVLNILTMAMAYEGSSPEYNDVLEKINYFFTAVFILESTLKIIALGPKSFWASGWNRFDLFVVLSSIVDIILTLMGSNQGSLLRVGPQLARIVRVLRVTRLLKLVKSMRGLQKLIETLIFSLPSLVNVGALLFLMFFIFSVLGWFLFKDVKKGKSITVYNNFFNWGNAMITLFRCSTGENWHFLMFDCMKHTIFGAFYFLSFILICSFIMLNLFILIIIQYFEDYHLKEDNPLDTFKENLEIFREHWSVYTQRTNGETLHQKQLVSFFQILPPPLGFGKKVKKEHIAKEVMSMNLIGDGHGNLLFNEVLFASMKRAFGQKILKDSTPEIQMILGKFEIETRKAIERNKFKKQKKNRNTRFSVKQNKHEAVNPLMFYLQMRMVYLAWKVILNHQIINQQNYSILKIVQKLRTPETSDEENEEDNYDSQSSMMSNESSLNLPSPTKKHRNNNEHQESQISNNENEIENGNYENYNNQNLTLLNSNNQSAMNMRPPSSTE